ncbi:hypothetical protein HNQ93_000730 [Hymenobacter luteus]|uniref:STAS/SEC14 domain-containing protein n=2 Tax=Hymenobacter TaxID=89966 RepID=A0A7W9SYW6_9BACT|nr:MULTISPECIES: hypothetical protein [Hymenobacter]MBB4599790.1 hypothetical protein [Hymenobacter latericoloratus]MBB6057900.1 hypothetical protein [Hymenobacter luteus]
MPSRLFAPHPGHSSAPQLSDLQLLQELPHLRLLSDAATELLWADWRGPQTAATVQEGAEAVLAAVQAGGYTKLLNDNTHLTAMNVTAQEWDSIQVLPRLFSAGLQYLAWVYPSDPRGRCHTDSSVNRSPWPLVLTFEERQMALEWLWEH